MRLKKNFEKPELEICEFILEDIVTTSGTITGGGVVLPDDDIDSSNG